MNTYKTKIVLNKTILALGAESAGNFSVFSNGNIYHSVDFGDLLNYDNFSKFKIEISEFLNKNKLKPDVILADLHPDYKTTSLGEKLAEKFKAKHVKVQHHIAHFYSTIGDYYLDKGEIENSSEVYGIVMDGTGLGEDETIWGGEIFLSHNENLSRIGHLENQTLIGADVAVREPARLLISAFKKIIPKDKVFNIIREHYNKNEFEMLWNQCESRFNTIETSSAGRVLDAVSVLLGFSPNKRESKHGPAKLLLENSTHPYSLKPDIIHKNNNSILNTTTLFEYLYKYINKDKTRLASTAQIYLARGFHDIIAHRSTTDNPIVFYSGGMTDNKIISDYFKSVGFITNKKVPRGDAGLSFGQIFSFLLEVSP